jgi:hypothetical protein
VRAVLFQLFLPKGAVASERAIFTVKIDKLIRSAWGIVSANHPLTVRFGSAHLSATQTEVKYKVFKTATAFALAPETFCVTNRYVIAGFVRCICEYFLDSRANLEDPAAKFVEEYLRDTSRLNEMDFLAVTDNIPVNFSGLVKNVKKLPPAILEPKTGTPTVVKAPSEVTPKTQPLKYEPMPVDGEKRRVDDMMFSGERVFWYDKEFANCPVAWSEFVPIAMVKPAFVATKPGTDLVCVFHDAGQCTFEARIDGDRCTKLADDENSAYLRLPGAGPVTITKEFHEVKGVILPAKIHFGRPEGQESTQTGRVQVNDVDVTWMSAIGPPPKPAMRGSLRSKPSSKPSAKKQAGGTGKHLS